MDRAGQSGEGGREWSGGMEAERSPDPMIILSTLLVCPPPGKKILRAPMNQRDSYIVPQNMYARGQKRWKDFSGTQQT